MTQTSALHIEPVSAAQRGFAARVTGVDIASGVSSETAALIEQAMDVYAVLIFPAQQINDDQQFRFSQHFGPMETATGDINARADRRLSMDINDISNLDKNGQVRSRSDRTRLFAPVRYTHAANLALKTLPTRKGRSGNRFCSDWCVSIRAQSGSHCFCPRTLAPFRGGRCLRLACSLAI